MSRIIILKQLVIQFAHYENFLTSTIRMMEFFVVYSFDLFIEKRSNHDFCTFFHSLD